tara:strand:+ start:4235 stop:4990 length:756 start_codon:yes stop_codon:yes gene_type:complete
MNILLITAAGKASRFHDVGYDSPKFLLPWTNRQPILNTIIKELCYSNKIDFILLIVNYREKYFKDRIEACLPSEINNKIIFVKDTLGQAHTTYLGVEELIKLKLENNPIIVHNSDTILKNRDIEVLTNFNTDLDICGYVNTFQSMDKNYSYVLETNGLVDSFLEKKIVSPLASSGLVSFSSGKKFHEIFNKLMTDNLEGDELFISRLINESIKKGDIYKIIHNNSAEDTIVLGTPEEYCKAYTLDSTGLGN